MKIQGNPAAQSAQDMGDLLKAITQIKQDHNNKMTKVVVSENVEAQVQANKANSLDLYI